MNRRSFLLAGAALAFAPRGLAAVGSKGSGLVALATADLESRLVAVDLRTGAIVGHIATVPYPRSIETVGNTAVVAHADIGAVTLVDGATGRVTRVLRDFAEPRYTAGHPDGRHAFITDAKRGELVTVDVKAGKIIAREQIGVAARHVSVNPSGTLIWAALGSKAKEIAVVDVSAPARPRLLRLLRPPFLAHDVAWAPDGEHVWVSSGDSRALVIYSSVGQVVARLPGDAPPQHITFGGQTAYVTSGLSGTLRCQTLEGGRLSVTRIPEGSYNVQYGHDRVVTPALGRGSLCILSPSGVLLNRDQVARSSHDACIVIT